MIRYADALIVLVVVAICIEPPLCAQGSAEVASGVILQQSTNDCGLAALAMLLRAAGSSVSLADLASEAKLPSSGATLLMLHQLASIHGVETEGVFVVASGQPPQIPVPWIAHIRTGIGHFVVVERATLDGWIVADPARGRVRYSANLFRQMWSGNALILKTRPGEIPQNHVTNTR